MGLAPVCKGHHSGTPVLANLEEDATLKQPSATINKTSA
jgi:hypothetical protein